jgi:Na+-transporting methylmalonyl-CoA/oxaloacetate decarboxylase gamma subunit
MLTFTEVLLTILYVLLGGALACLFLFLCVLIVYGVSRVYATNRLVDKGYASYKKTDEEVKERTQQEKALTGANALQAPFLVWATSVSLAIQQFFATAFSIFYEIVNVIAENRAAFIATLILTGAAVLVHYYLPEILFVLQLIYNAVGLPIRKIFFYTWNSVALILDATLPVWNFAVTLTRNTLSTLTDTLFRCSDLAFLFETLGGVFSTAFSDIFTWIGTPSNLVNVPLDLTGTAKAVAAFTEALITPATCVCRDLKPIWVALDRPLHSPNFAILLTSLVNIGISLGQVIANTTAYQRPFTLEPVFNNTAQVVDSATGLVDDYLNSFYFIFIAGNESYVSPYANRARPYIQSTAEPERLPAIFGPILGNLIAAPISFVNITAEALVNFRSVVGRGSGPVSGSTALNYDPVFDRIYDATWALQNISVFLANELKKIDSGEVYLDFVEDILVYAAGLVRHGVNALVLLLQSVYNSVVSVVFSLYDENESVYNLLFRIWGYREERGLKIPSPFFNELRFFSQDMGCLISFFHEPSGAVVRSALYVVCDLLQTAVQWVITVIQIIEVGNIAKAKFKPVDFDLLFADIATLAGSAGDLIREFSPGCYNIAFNNDVSFGCVVCDEAFRIGDPMYNAYCNASFRFTERYASGGVCCQGENDVDAFCAAGNLLDATALLASDLLQTIVNSTKDISEFNASRSHDQTKFNGYFEKDIRSLSRVFTHFGYTVAYSISDIQVVVDFGPVISSLLNVTTIPLWIVNDVIKIAASGEDVEDIVTNLITGIVSIILENIIILLNNLATWARGFSPALGSFFFGFSNALAAVEGDLLTLLADLVQWAFYAVVYFFTGQWGQLIAVTITYADQFGTLLVDVLAKIGTDIFNAITSLFDGSRQFAFTLCTAANTVLKIFSPFDVLDCSGAFTKRSVDIGDDAKQALYERVLRPSGLLERTNGISKCQIVFAGYEHTPWTDMTPTEQGTFYECLESVQSVAGLNSVTGGTPLPLDFWYNSPTRWKVAASMFRGASLRSHYTWHRTLYADTDALRQHMRFESITRPLGEETLPEYYARNGFEYGAQIEWGVQLLRSVVQSTRLFDVDLVKYYTVQESEDSGANILYYSTMRRFFEEFNRASDEYTRANPPESVLQRQVVAEPQAPAEARQVSRRSRRERTGVLDALRRRAEEKVTPQAAENTASVVRFYNRHAKRSSCIAESSCADCRAVTDVIDATLDASTGISRYYADNFTASVAFYDKFFAQLNSEPWFGDEETAPKLQESRVFKNRMFNWRMDWRSIPGSYRIGEGRNKCNHSRTRDVLDTAGTNVVTRTEAYIRYVEEFFNFSNFTEFIDDLSCFLTDPNTSSPESAGYYVNALLSCPYEETTNPSRGIGLLDALLIVYVGLIVLGVFGVITGTASIALWVLSPFLVFVLAYWFSPACFPAVPVRFVDDLTMILNETLPPCAFANDFNASAGGSCTAIPPQVTFYSAEQVGFNDWRDNTVFAIQSHDSGFAASILNGTGFGYRAVEFILSSASLERWANVSTPTVLQSDYFWYTFGNFFILGAELAAAAVVIFLFLVPIASFFIFCIGIVIFNTVVLAAHLWAFTRSVFAEESLREEYTGTRRPNNANETEPVGTQGAAATLTHRRKQHL